MALLLGIINSDNGNIKDGIVKRFQKHNNRLIEIKPVNSWRRRQINETYF